MRYYFTDSPQYIPYFKYEDVIDAMVEKISKYKGLVSIYQIGSVSTPGISDIDMIAVFKDDTNCKHNPRRNLSRVEKYLFCHGLYGIMISDYHNMRKHSILHNYKHLWGEVMPREENGLSIENVKVLKRQIALEFLLKMYISLTVERTYRIIKLRSLLLHIKALLYDLDFLNISSGKLLDLINEMVCIRNSWFKKAPEVKELIEWIDEFYSELEIFLEKIFVQMSFYVPKEFDTSIAMNIKLVHSENFGYYHNGMILPPILRGLGRKYFNMQHRLNYFQFLIPYDSSSTLSILKERFSFSRSLNKKCKSKMKYFMPVTSSLNIL